MGLDMYAFKIRPALLADPEAMVDLQPAGSGENEEDQAEQIASWRKHPNLHGWMHHLYIAKGGTDREFNGNTVRLTEELLDVLEADITAGELPPTSGFFFGQSTPEDRDDDLLFVAKARAALAEGYVVFYDSWW
ncbi:hypothetical protein HNR62_000319 [Oceanisphaera litoralis]|uniref:hypothetical protein n=1 Tax=Oceanisphaera litoralis TaxID=225144 RepID=UPI00195B2C7A|nr:hypothetical protein [Oceanisphaera litoralis]MBM7454490.1 hypothetical protein [Oceanisphaera litoralis]